MQRILLSVTLLFTVILLNAQTPTFKWAKKMGGISNHEGRAIAVDAQGNVYAIGDFKGTSDFDPGAGTFNLTSAGDKDIFISKINASGNLIWAKRIGGTLVEDAYNLALDAGGNVYSTGTFQGTVDFDPGAGTFNLTTNGAFILKLDSSGNFAWAKNMAATAGISIAVGEQGHVYATGNQYITKLDLSGKLIWSKAIGGISSALALDASENIYPVGSFSGTADFNPGAGTNSLTSVGGLDIFLAKYDSSGKFTWVRQLGTTFSEGVRSVAIDKKGNVCASGYFNNSMDFDPGAGTYTLVSNPAGYDLFILKLNASGNFVWAKKIGEEAADDGFSIAVDATGNVYTTGFFADTVDFDPGTGKRIIHPEGLSFDAYISILDSSGNYKWAQNFGGTLGDMGMALTVDAAGSIYLEGGFSGTVDFNPDTAVYNLTSATNDNYFVMKLTVCPVIDITTNITGKTVKANQNGATYQWIDCNNGNTPVSGQTNQSYSPVKSGKYKVIITLGGCSSTSACVNVAGSNIQGNNITNAFTVYPNPTNGIFNITLSNPSENVNIEVYNTMGAVIYKTKSEGQINTIDLSHYANGLYVIKLFGEDNLVTTQKIMKQ